MKYIFAIFLVINQLTEKQNLVGIYEYKSAEDSENHQIVFNKIDGQLKGFYFGTEDGKGHGIFFYTVEMTKLTIDKEGKIEFEIGDRLLFETTRFKIVKTENQREESVGRASRVLKYKGQIKTDKIELTCASELQDCWTKELTFEKIR